MNIRISVSWLREYLKTDLATKTIVNYLTLSGPSVERIENTKDDQILDIEVTSNRPDAYSVHGLARETNAILKSHNQNSQLVPPVGTHLNLQPDTKEILKLDVLIKKNSLCPRFAAIVLGNIKIKKSPAFVKNRLEACGIRPINNVVDITNYIMLELGQPMHAFDFDKVKGSKMILRESKKGERMKTLDGQTRILPQEAIVIEDNERLIDLCGIMGGENSQISSRTKRIIMFVQAYDSIKIRKTTQALAFRTEAAARFEKGVDIEAIPQALSRAVYLAKKTAGAKIASELIDIYPLKTHSNPISLDLEKLNQYLELTISGQKSITILKNLGFSAKIVNSKIIATPPSFRSNDIEIDVDLIEEIARIYGYQNLPSKLPTGEIPKTEISIHQKVIELKKALKFLGLTEVISYSIISKDLLNLSRVKDKDIVELTNPLTDQWQFMRPSLVPSLVEVIAKNHDQQKNTQIFEIAKTYLKQENNLPIQDLYLTVVCKNQDFYQIKGLIENILQILGYVGHWDKSDINQDLFENSLSASLTAEGKKIGTVGSIAKHITGFFEINDPIVAAEINLTILYSFSPKKVSYQPIDKYPPVIEDISAIFPKTTPIGKIQESLNKLDNLIKKAEIIDVYKDPKIGKNKKSVTFRITYQKLSGTPTQEEITRIREKIISSLTKTFQAEIRR